MNSLNWTTITVIVVFYVIILEIVVGTYLTPPWRSYQTRFWEPSGDILAEALVGLNNAWQSVGMVIHGEVPYHKSAVCLQNTFLAVAS